MPIGDLPLPLVASPPPPPALLPPEPDVSESLGASGQAALDDAIANIADVGDGGELPELGAVTGAASAEEGWRLAASLEALLGGRKNGGAQRGGGVNASDADGGMRVA